MIQILNSSVVKFCSLLVSGIKSFGGHQSFLWVTDTPVLDITSGATPAYLLAASLAAEPYSLYVLTHVYRHWWDLNKVRNAL